MYMTKQRMKVYFIDFFFHPNFILFATKCHMQLVQQVVCHTWVFEIVMYTSQNIFNYLLFKMQLKIRC
jgi:hypothetical protein